MSVPHGLVRAKHRLVRKGWAFCEYCGIQLTKETGTWDHVIPRAFGGTRKRSNLVLACKSCNEDKGASTARQFLSRKVSQK